MNTCSSCKYFCRGGHFKDGQCRRYPPDDNLRPSVKLSDWCGEWGRKDMFTNHPKPRRPEKIGVRSACEGALRQDEGWNLCCDAWEEYLETVAGMQEVVDGPCFLDHLQWFQDIAEDCECREKRMVGITRNKYTYLCSHPQRVHLNDRTCRQKICPLIAHEN